MLIYSIYSQTRELCDPLWRSLFTVPGSSTSVISVVLKPKLVLLAEVS